MPLAVILLAVSGYYVMQLTAAQPVVIPPEKKEVIVEYTEARKQMVSLVVRSQGTVIPAIQTELMAEVGGKIIEIADGLQTGGLFRQGEMLLQIDPREYQDAVIEAEAELARAQSLLTKEEAHAEQAKKNWKLLGRGKPSQLALRIPQLAESQAAVRAAKAHLNRARRNLEKTRIIAPYDLLVKNRTAEPHGYVIPGASLVSVFSVEAVEIRLPITNAQLALLEMPAPSLTATAASGPLVTLQNSSSTAGQINTWLGNIVRAENIFTPQSRVTHVIARVRDPYRLQSNTSAQILAVGMFVQAEIQGKVIFDKIVIPTSALLEPDNVWIIRQDNTLTKRNITQLYNHDEYSVIAAGLNPGDRVCVSGVDFATEDLKVRPVQSAEMLLVNNGEKYAQ